MEPRTLRRLWFAGLWLMLPWPMVVFGDSLVPAVRYLLLFGVSSAVAVTQGAAGPVGLIVVLFAAMAAGTTLACWLLAWAIAKALVRLPAPLPGAITGLVLGAALLGALAFEPYRTSFGRALTGNLLDVLS